MNERRALIVVLALGGVLVTWAAARYAREVEGRHGAPSAARAADPDAAGTERGDAAVLPRSEAGAGVHRQGSGRPRDFDRVAARQGRDRQLLGDLVRALPRRDPGSGGAAGEVQGHAAGDRHLGRRSRRRGREALRCRAQGQLPGGDDDAGAGEAVSGDQRAADLLHPRPSVTRGAEARRHADGAHHRIRSAAPGGAAGQRLDRGVRSDAGAADRQRRAGDDDPRRRPRLAAGRQAHRGAAEAERATLHLRLRSDASPAAASTTRRCGVSLPLAQQIVKQIAGTP